jgi:glycosyltransferase involved in cell wall biosynthesis
MSYIDDLVPPAGEGCGDPVMGLDDRAAAVHTRSDATTALVTIVIPCYGQAHFLAEAIESALAQTYPHVEIIVVNDGSRDETASVAARYRAVRYVEQANQGLAAARNTGLAHSRGEFLVFLDADDRLLPHAVLIQMAVLMEQPTLGFVAGASRFISQDGTPLPTIQRTPPRGNAYIALLRRNHMRMPAMVMFRRRVFEEVGAFDSDVNACADYDMYLRVSRHYPVAFHEELVAEYRRHDDNMSLDSALMLRQLLRVLRRQCGHVRRDRERRGALREGLQNVREYYGDRLANTVRERVRTGSDWGATIRDTATLVALHPGGVLVHLLRLAVNSRHRLGRRANATARRWFTAGSD